MDSSGAFAVTLGAWAVLEVSLRAREAVQGRGRTRHDHLTRVRIAASIGAAIGLGVLTSMQVPSLALPAALGTAGIAVIWTGLLLRGWAIAALGSSFRTTVEVDAGQPVVTTGPYALIRHPSYTGLLLILTGFGLACGNGLAVAICAFVPLPAVVRRIAVEEAELTRVLNEEYRRYQERTDRLVPGIW